MQQAKANVASVGDVANPPRGIFFRAGKKSLAMEKLEPSMQRGWIVARLGPGL